jgi:two-component sensor histidine kinase
MFDARSRAVFDALPCIVGFTDASLRCQYANRRYAEFIGKPLDWFKDRPVREIWGESIIKDLAPRLAQALAGVRVEFTHRAEDWRGTSYDASASLIPQEEGGRVAGYILVVSDLSEVAHARQDGAVEERERLIKELDHRINDMLQVIRSIVSLESQFARDESATELLAALGRRVAALGAVFGLLRANRGGPVPALRAAEEILEVCELEASLEIGEGLFIPNGQLDAFVFILEELVRNACRHGGRAALRLAGDGAGGLVLEVRDRGPGLPEGASVERSRSVGFTLISSFAQGCGARVDYGYEEGARFRVSFPPPTARPEEGYGSLRA